MRNFTIIWLGTLGLVCILATAAWGHRGSGRIEQPTPPPTQTTEMQTFHPAGGPQRTTPAGTR